MNHLMREDARRRFVIGFTIEDVNMRLWYCSRSDVFVSETLDWQKVRGVNPIRCVHQAVGQFFTHRTTGDLLTSSFAHRLPIWTRLAGIPP